MDSMDECKLRSEFVKGNVRFIKNGFLYVDVNDFVIKIKNPYDYEPNFVELVKYCGEYYIKNFVPKKNEK